MSGIGDTFKLNYPPTLTLRAKVYNRDETDKIFKPIMEEMAPYSNELLKKLLLFRSDKYTLDGVHYSKDDAEKQLKDIYKEHKFKISFAEFKGHAKKIYESFVCYIDKKGKIKVNSKATSYVNVFFNSKDIKIPEACKESLQLFRKHNIFPILVNGKESAGKLKYGISKDVLIRLTSMEEISKEYEKSKVDSDNAFKAAQGDLPHIYRYGEFLASIKMLEEYSAFGLDNYRRFLSRWRDNGRNGKPGMRTYFLNLRKQNKTYLFKNSDKYLFGYSSEFMNLIFNDFQDLWVKEDTIGMQRKELRDRDYVDIVFKSYHWRKESIGVSSFANNGKRCRILLGDNLQGFELKDENGIWSVYVRDVLDKNKFHKLILCNSPHFSDTSSMTLVKRDKKNGEKAKKNTIQFRYSADSKRKTWYSGYISEPVLRYSVAKNEYYVDFPIAEHREEGIVNTAKIAKGFSNYFATSIESGTRQKDKKTIPLDKFRVVGYDMGMVNPFMGAVYDVEMVNGALTHKFVEYIRPFINDDEPRRIRDINSLRDRIKAAKILILLTNDFISEKIDKIPGTYHTKGVTIDFMKTLGVNVSDYQDQVAKIKSLDGEVYKNIRRRENGWYVSSIIHSIQKDFSKIRSEFTDNKNKKNYCEKMNHVSMSTFLKKDMVKSYISLLRSFSTFGMTPKESEYFRKGFGRKLLNWHNGLARKCTYIASDMINAARGKGAQVVFIEDLDCHPSQFDSKDKNELKNMLGWGEIKKWMYHKANKHNICVIAVDPHLTSIVNNETGLLGIAKDRNIYTFLDNGKPNVIDRDENAAHNIVKRGLLRHGDMREFNVDQIEEGKYRLVTDEMGKEKRKKGSLFKYIGSTECIFVKSKDGSLSVSSKEVSRNEKSMPRLNNERMYVFLHGETWRLRHELDGKDKDKKKVIGELGIKLDNYLKNKKI